MKGRIISILLLLTIYVFGSDGAMELLQRVNEQIQEFKDLLKIDQRETVFSIRTEVTESKIVLVGEMSDQTLRDQLVKSLSEKFNMSIDDRILLLPEHSLGDRVYAVVNLPYVNLMDAPRRTAQKNAVTQARMGEIVKLLKQNGDWYLVQMEDSYLGWVERNALWIVDRAELDEYLSKKFVLVTSKFADLYNIKDKGSLEKKLVQGTTLPYLHTEDQWVVIELPSGDQALVLKEDVELYDSREKVFFIQKGAEYIIEVAKMHLGLPYLWAGTTSYGFDCSGFTQFCFKMAGYFLRRDADMQFQQGQIVNNREELKAGDLVFFQTYKPGPSHVGIYIGNMKYIHSGSKGVAINSFDPNSPDYSADLDKKYIGARRIIP
ncbi:NlpC/P60 family protein [Pseudothermotoga sp. U03pept]|uniref:C40 family peptidase n=1 Tax=Pseudothermotoga sp. U03pept TaxID=3447012 RepID=UPI003EFF49F8